MPPLPRALREADLNHDGRLSFEEFQKWYSNPDSANYNLSNNVEEPMDIDDDDDESRFVPLEELRRITGLNSVFPDEVFSNIRESPRLRRGVTYR